MFPEFWIFINQLNLSVPDSFISVGSNWRWIGAFRPSRRDCARLRDRRISWIVWKFRALLFLSLIEAEIFVKSDLPQQFKKYSHKWKMFQQLIYDAQRKFKSFISIFKILWAPSARFQGKKNREFCENHGNIFWIVKVLVIRKIFQLHLMIEKPRPDVLTVFMILNDLSV